MFPLQGRSTRGVARSRARKRPEDSDVDVLSLLLLAYALGRELPLLRRRVALAIATMTGPFASTLFLHCSMGVTVEQQFVSILGDRAEQNLSNGSADRAAQLHAIQALLVAPVLPEHLLFQEGRITLKTKGKIAAASNGRQDLILQDIETWAHDRLALYAHHLRDKAVVCALAALPGEARQSILLSRWAPNCTPILIQLPVEPSNQQGACDTADVGKQVSARRS